MPFKQRRIKKARRGVLRYYAAVELKKGDNIEIKIRDLAFGGAGVGEAADGRAVFVAGAVPGDTALARITKIKPRYAEADLERLITPSLIRIKPRCKHFGVCGGCSLQMLPYEDQLKWKEKMVYDALEKIGGLKIDASARGRILGCAEPWFYRNKMEYSFGQNGAGFRTATSGGVAGALTLGLHPKKNFRDAFNLEECFLESPMSVEIVAAVRRFAAEHGAEYHTLTVREAKNTGEFMINLAVGNAGAAHDESFAEMMRENFPSITSLYLTSILRQKGRRTTLKEKLLYGKPALAETLTVNGITLHFEILPSAFFQPNTVQAEVLYGKILEFALPSEDKTALDLFCGTGTIGMFLAKAGANVTGLDLNESAIENARANALKNSVKKIKFLCGDIKKILPRLSRPPDIIITDPPRAGIDAKPLKSIIALKSPKWIYVSCNPASLARDLKEIAASGYQIKKIQPVDMFPQTYHVENVCLLSSS